MSIQQIEDREYLNLLFYHMPTTQLKILRARYVLGYTAREICDNLEILGLSHYSWITPSYVYSLQKRAIGRLTRLNNYYQSSKEFVYE